MQKSAMLVDLYSMQVSCVTGTPIHLRSIMSKYFLGAVLGLILLFDAGATESFAKSGNPTEQQRCTGDVSRFCRKFIADGDFAVLGCLKQNRRFISSGCRKVLRENGQ